MEERFGDAGARAVARGRDALQDDRASGRGHHARGSLCALPGRSRRRQVIARLSEVPPLGHDLLGLRRPVADLVGERDGRLHDGGIGLLAQELQAVAQIDEPVGDDVDDDATDGVRIINAFQEDLYKCYGKPQNFRGVLYPGVGHDYTNEMWEETINWLKKHL